MTEQKSDIYHVENIGGLTTKLLGCILSILVQSIKIEGSQMGASAPIIRLNLGRLWLRVV